MLKLSRFFLVLVVVFVSSLVGTLNAGKLYGAESVENEIADVYREAGVVEWIQRTTGGEPIRINDFQPGEGMDRMFATNVFRTPLLGLENGGKSIVVEEVEGGRTNWTLSGKVHLEAADYSACSVELELTRGRKEEIKFGEDIKFDSPNIIATIMPVGQGTPAGREETTQSQAATANGVAGGYAVNPANGSVDDHATGESPAVSGEYKIQIISSDGKPYALKEYQLKARESGEKLGEIYQCTLNKGKSFKLLIENNSDCDAAVEVNIDGVSALALWEDKENKPYFFIIPQGGVCEVPGWLMNASGKANGREFTAGYYKDSVAKQLHVNPKWEDGKSEISFLFRRAGKGVQDLGPEDDAVGIGKGNVIDVPTEMVEIPVASTAHCKISVWYSVK